MDVFYIFIWWLTIFVMGISGFPLVSKILGRFIDKGYGLSKTFSIVTISYIAFLFSILKILPLQRGILISLILIFMGTNILLIYKARESFVKQVKGIWQIMLFEEVLFAAGLIFWAYVRAHQPDINGLEKFMDYGFIKSSSLTQYLPPPDIWFAGQGINYYWFGHFISGLLTKISSVPSGVTYNLMLATILGLSLSGTFSLVSTLIHTVLKTDKRRVAIIGGLISAIVLNFAGNFHTPYFIYKNGRDAYWYPDATRFIGYNPDVPDKTIHEFPMYSYVVADVHAHILNLPFVILFLSLLYVSLPFAEIAIKRNYLNLKLVIGSLNLDLGKSRLFNFMLGYKKVFLLGILLGIMFMGNAWDFANYLLASGFVYLIYFARREGIKFETLFKISFPLLILIGMAVISALPFVLNFESIAQGVKLTHTKSPIWQLAILWGFPGVMTLIFLMRAITSKAREDLFILGLLAASWSLIAIPEFIYVKDIYAESHYRANTMFKLTYQAFVMTYLASGYIAIRVLTGLRNKVLQGISYILFVVMFASILHYAPIATKSYYADLKVYKGLDGETWLKEKDPDIYNAIIWLRENNKDQPVILEAPGDSYTEYNSISSYTGFPTVSGWFVHEWLWRGSPDHPQKRVDDITSIYNSANVTEVKLLLQKYNVRYVVVGKYEKEKFPELKEAKFDEIGDPVFTSPTTKIYKVSI
jgi:uncharacterized membrane protein